MSLHLPLTFTGSTITGAGHGRKLGAPTINIVLTDVPEALEHGVYACTVNIHTHSANALPGALHYGPRHTFDSSVACEVHVLDTVVEEFPQSVTITVIGKVRNVQRFESADELRRQIADDIQTIRSILEKFST